MSFMGYSPFFSYFRYYNLSFVCVSFISIRQAYGLNGHYQKLLPRQYIRSIQTNWENLLTFSSIFCQTCLHRMMTMIAIRMAMIATKQPIRILVLLSSTLWVGSSPNQPDESWELRWLVWFNPSQWSSSYSMLIAQSPSCFITTTVRNMTFI